MRRLILAITTIACLGAACSAQAHYKAGPNDSGNWYFDGASTSGPRDALKDPLNFIFYGGSADQTAYTKARIEQHMVDDWDTSAVGGRPWRQDSIVAKLCKIDQRVYWLNENFTATTSDKTDWHGTTSRMSMCGAQTHARFWDDQEHARFTTTHGREDQWVVGGIHHEHPVAKLKILPGTTHRIDRDWDAMRYLMVRAMHAHCSEARWKYHPGADGVFGCGDYGHCYDNEGWLARFSLHHASDGGCAGY